MKKLLTSTLFLVCIFVYGQTIEVSNKYNTNLIFPDDVVTKTLGQDDLFAFLNDESKSSRILGLKFFGTENVETNLHVITAGGDIFDLKLVFKSEPLKRTYIVSTSDKVYSLNESREQTKEDKVYSSYSVKPKTAVNLGSKDYTFNDQLSFSSDNQQKNRLVSNRPTLSNTRVDINDPFYNLTKENADNYGENYIDFVREKAGSIRGKKPRYFLPRNKYSSKEFNISMRLKGIYRIKNEQYIAIEVHNKSNNPYEIGGIQLVVDSGESSKYTIDQPLQIQPVLSSGLVKEIGGGRKMEIVLAISKLTLENHKVLKLMLDEENGERALTLAISADNLNNPIRS